jgi:hypothetical protein
VNSLDTAWSSRAPCRVLFSSGLIERVHVANSLHSRRKERRIQDGLIVIERRKGKAFLYGQAILFMGLMATLLWLITD